LNDLNARRRKVALLVVLAMRKQPVSRDTLLEMFWGGQEEARARHSLSDAVSHLRRVLRRDAIVATRSEIALGADAPLVLDVAEFEELVATDRRRAIALYAGRFLDGVHVSESVTFDAWLSREQNRLERILAKACELECTSLESSGRMEEMATIAERWLDIEPLSTNAANALMTALGAPGTTESDARVLAAYERLRARLAREYDVSPASEIVQRASRISEAMRTTAPTNRTSLVPDATPQPIHAESSRIDSTPSSPPRTRNVPYWRRRVWLASAAAVALITVSAALDARRSDGATGTPPRSVLAVAEIVPGNADTASRWLIDGLPQMIAAKLLRASDVDVVPPAEIRAVRARSETQSGSLSVPALRDLGRRSGATLVVSGTFMNRSNVNVLDLRLLDVRNGNVLRLETVADSSVLTLVDRAVVRLLDAVGANDREGPRLAEVETANLAAYEHFVRSYQLGYDHPAEAIAELDAAVALDSGFTSAVLGRVTQAIADNDGPTIAKLSAVLQKQNARIPERDRLEWESRVTFMDGDIARSEALARLLVERFPRDPRGYQMLAMIYDIVGRWDAQEKVLERLLALDSLGMEAGRGPCVSCYGLGNLTSVRMFRGDWSGAERVARRWTSLTPEMHAAWTNLALAQAYHGNYRDAFNSAARATALAPEEPSVSLTSAWLQLMSRNLDAAESAIAAWESSGSRTLRMQALDLRATLQRERGQFRAANATIQRAIAEFPEFAILDLERADGLVRIGDCRNAVMLIESVHGSKPMTAEPAPGGASRAFAWHHALLADAIARSTNCAPAARLDALADSIERIGRRSYYGRDWTLHHHVRGLIAMRSGDYARAEDELRKAQWRVADAWTRSTVELAKVQLERGRTTEAIATLRNAYASRPDAMGRYQPRSELDYFMALAFRRANMLDSAAVYEDYVRRAWSNADPEVKQLLDRRVSYSLPGT
jgi:DNA-binding SARP family transcriptional activator/Flp pilus assembly protein TadD/TolB-like protein